MNTNRTNDTTTAATVDTMTPRKSEQNKAHGAARWAYNGGTTYSDIFTAYGKPSAAKVAAWDHCKELCRAFNGSRLVINDGQKLHEVFSRFPVHRTGDGRALLLLHYAGSRPALLRVTNSRPETGGNLFFCEQLPNSEQRV